MRIGLISQEYPPETAKGGIGTQTVVKAHGLAALGHEVTVISRSPDNRRSERREGRLQVIRLPSTPMAVYTELADWLTYSQRVAEEIAAQHAASPFDLLDFPEWGCEGYVHLLNQSRWNRIPSVIHLHGPLVMLARTLGWPDTGSEFFRVGTQMEGTCLRLADAVYSSSDCSADWCAREYGLARAQIPRLHTGVDLKLFRPLPVAKASRPTVVFVGKLVPNKGVELLVDAACRLAADIPGLHLRLLGRSEAVLVEALRGKVAARGLEAMLDLPGPVAREQLPDHLARAHVFAAPSQYEGGPGFVYLEAMGCGLPVIACSGSGAAEAVAHGESGLLLPPGDLEALVAALRRLLGDAGLRAQMGRRARHQVEEHADAERCVAAIAHFYEGVVSRCRAGEGE